jgi:hypothetical protein
MRPELLYKYICFVAQAICGIFTQRYTEARLAVFSEAVHPGTPGGITEDIEFVVKTTMRTFEPEVATSDFLANFPRGLRILR